LDRDLLLSNVAPVIDASPPGLPRYRFDLKTPWSAAQNLEAPLAGFHQVANTALAVSAITRLASAGYPAGPDALRAGLSRVDLPRRLEVLRRSPLVIVDSAHNDASIRALRETIQDFPARRRTLVFGSSRDKETARLLEIAVPAFDRIIVTPYLL